VLARCRRAPLRRCAVRREEPRVASGDRERSREIARAALPILRVIVVVVVVVVVVVIVVIVVVVVVVQ